MKSYRLATYSDTAVLVAKGGQAEVSSKTWANVFYLLRLRCVPREVFIDIVTTGCDMYDERHGVWHCIYFSEHEEAIENYDRLPNKEMLDSF